MGYLIGLFLILGVIFYSFNPFGPHADILSNAKNSIGNVLGSLESKIYGTVFPKSEKEILIDKLGSNYNILNKFFSETAPEMLKSENVSPNDKKVLQDAIIMFNDSKTSLQNIKNLESNSKGVIQSIVDKFIKPNETQAPNTIEPTSIPTQCNLVCGE